MHHAGLQILLRLLQAPVVLLKEEVQRDAKLLRGEDIKVAQGPARRVPPSSYPKGVIDTPITENQMEKQMENEMEAKDYVGVINVCTDYLGSYSSSIQVMLFETRETKDFCRIGRHSSGLGRMSPDWDTCVAAFQLRIP